MRLTTVILIASLMQVSAATFGQHITLNQRNTPLEAVLKEIRKQSGYDFYYDGKIIPKNQEVSIAVTNATIDEALESIFSGLAFTYKIDGKSVVIKKKEVSVLENIITRFQAIDVEGKITDEKGNALPGASIKVKGKNQRATSDQQGRFTLTHVEEDAMLVIDYVGYVSRELKVKPVMGNIVLTASNSALDDVQIIAYGTTTKRLNTGSQAGIKAADIERQPVNNPLEALSGRIPGLDITQSSGAAGTGFTIRIRGVNSVRQNANDPLFIVDGIPYSSADLNGINGNNISSLAGTLSPLNAMNASDIES
ncbi:MAG TPA: carboxypeptidase-like regulatory domain-containing protein, partial [Pedobacter sp.]